MKIKEVIELIDSKEEKVYTAHKIYNSSLHIKKAIKEWVTDKDLPLVSVCIEGPEDNYVNISSYDLLNIYGFSELQALLMIADMENAQKDKDIEKLRYMLSSLTSGRHETKMYLSENFYIRSMACTVLRFINTYSCGSDFQINSGFGNDVLHIKNIGIKT